MAPEPTITAFRLDFALTNALPEPEITTFVSSVSSSYPIKLPEPLIMWFASSAFPDITRLPLPDRIVLSESAAVFSSIFPETDKTTF